MKATHFDLRPPDSRRLGRWCKPLQRRLFWFESTLGNPLVRHYWSGGFLYEHRRAGILFRLIEASVVPRSQTKAPSGDTMPARIVQPSNGKAHSEHNPDWR